MLISAQLGLEAGTGAELGNTCCFKYCVLYDLCLAFFSGLFMMKICKIVVLWEVSHRRDTCMTVVSHRRDTSQMHSSSDSRGWETLNFSKSDLEIIYSCTGRSIFDEFREITSRAHFHLCEN